MKLKKKLIGLVVLFALISTCGVIPNSTYEEVYASSTITVKQFVKDLEKKTGTDVTTKATGKLTNEVAADLLVQAYHQKNGSISVKKDKWVNSLDGTDDWKCATKMTLGFDEVLDNYSAARASNVYKYNRISDLSKASKSYQKDLILAYTYGLMGGKSNGTYSQNRSMNPKGKVTVASAKKYINRVVGTEDPLVVAPDGQLTRKNNLPKNAANFRYILASFPNSYYEMVPVQQKYSKKYADSIPEVYWDSNRILEKTHWVSKRLKDSTKLGVCDFTFAMCMDEKLIDIVKTDLEQTLNVNYKTIDKDWVNKLAKTYKSRDDYEYVRNNINTYVKAMKKNKVIIKSDKIVVETSSLYLTGGKLYVRCYVEFTVKSAKSTEDRTANNTVIGFGCGYNKDYKVGKKIKAYVDVPVWQDTEHVYRIADSCVFVDVATAPKLTKSIYEYKFTELDEYNVRINCKKQHQYW